MKKNNNEWFYEAIKLHEKDPIKYNITYLANEFDKSFDCMRGRIRRYKEKKIKNTNLSIEDNFFKALKEGKELHTLYIEFGKKETNEMIKKLKGEGIVIKNTPTGLLKIEDFVIPSREEFSEKWSKRNKVLYFGLVSDTHLCSNWQQLTSLNTIYDIFQQKKEELGLDDLVVYHAGDISEGSGMRQGHEYEVFAHGFQAQKDYIVKNYPSREGIITKFITGNHDAIFMRKAGANIGVAIANDRHDMVYLGNYNARVNLTPNCIMEINHPWDGSAYAVSYSIQKQVETIPESKKPDIFVNGHHHKMLSLIYQGVFCIEAGSFEGHTPFMLGKKLSSTIGGFFIKVEVDQTGKCVQVTPEYISFDEILKDY